MEMLGDKQVDTAVRAIFFVVLILVSLGIYFLPSIIAWARETAWTGAAIVINIFLGWTLIGWVVALAMAVSGTPRES
jgi:hypothetical protein